jgi:predicted MFS family arabinose efflux permease
MSTELRKQLLVMAVGAGSSVALLYFCQPLLAEMAQSFKVPDHEMHWVPAITQLGAALGTMFILPLSDRLERRGLAVRMCWMLSGAAVCTACAPNFVFLLAGSLLVGFATCIPHLLVPIATLVAPPGQNARAISIVMSGLLVGVLLGRTLAGILGGTFGWRIVYLIGAAIVLLIGYLLRRTLPECHSNLQVSYGELLASAVKLFRHRTMRESAFISAMLFGAFNAFWTTLIFLLGTPPYHYGARTAGALGLLAASSALAAPMMGRLVDRKSARFGVGVSIVTLLISFVILKTMGLHLFGLMLGIIVLDASAQCGHVANLARVYGTFKEARSRAGMDYMVCFFLGGSLGSSLGGYGWNRMGWTGVCLAGSAMTAAALAVHFLPGAASDSRMQLQTENSFVQPPV